jgi:lipid II:glycine glycyltransferase (peptidoglycan interpeptide bridge formation enzyme)
LNCMRIEPPSTTFVSPTCPTGSKSIELGLFTVDLTKSAETIFAEFNAKYRTQIRKAEKSGVEVKYGVEQIERFFECYADTHRRQGLDYERLDFFRQFYQFLGPEKVLCATADYNGQVESGVFLVFTPFGGYYLYAGSAEKTQFKGSTKMILWDCMNIMKEKGAKKFVLGGARYKNVAGTKYEGIQLFKSLFGSTITDGYIWKKDLKPLQCAIYDVLFWAKCAVKGISVPKDFIDSQL